MREVNKIIRYRLHKAKKKEYFENELKNKQEAINILNCKMGYLTGNNGNTIK